MLGEGRVCILYNRKDPTHHCARSSGLPVLLRTKRRMSRLVGSILIRAREVIIGNSDRIDTVDAQPHVVRLALHPSQDLNQRP